MIKNYFLTALRNIYKNKTVSFINIFGLSVGISSCILIFLFVTNELNYDRHHTKADRIYRVTSILNLSGQDDNISYSSYMFSPTVKEDFPEVEEAVRLSPLPKQTLWFNERVFQVERLYFADPELFKILDYEFLQGDPNTALKEPQSIVVTDELARTLFGTEDALGKMLKFTMKSYKVTGVIKHRPDISHIEVNGFLSISSMNPGLVSVLERDWFYMLQTNYVLFKNPINKEEFENKLKGMVDEKIVPWLKSENVNGSITYKLQALKDIRLNSSDFKHEYARVSNKSNIRIFSSIGFLILVIACINYLNLATARSARRSREVGIRKTAGASRSQLFYQFIGESMLTVFVSLIIALCFVELLLPAFNYLSGKSLALTFNLGLVSALLASVLIIGIFSGLYPAWFLSGFQPVKVLKTGQIPGSGSAIFRKLLVTVQFAIAVFMISCTLIVYGQMQYMKNKNPGFDNQRVLAFRIPGADTAFVSKFEVMKGELMSNPNIQKVSLASQVPGEFGGKVLQYIRYKGKAEEKLISIYSVDADFLDLMKIPLIKGRNFDENNEADDTAAFLVNQAAIREFGWDSTFGVELMNGFGYDGKVVGVINDYHFMPMQQPIEPLVLVKKAGGAGGGVMLLKLGESNVKETVAFAENTWKKYSKKYPTEYFFVDENFNSKYEAEDKRLKIFGYFSVIAIIVACLGLFGLVSYSIEQRTKEIGIRKVIGASTLQVVFVLIKSYLLLILLAIIIAIPCAYIYMNKWLTDFAYHITPGIQYFLLAVLAASLIALLTMLWQALKAAWLNPANSLKYE
ncbi:MAG TPA: FtsX-like permease family protein [Bacteroidia bacterium]|nr:FtsX-like permease family protein [Bacteroidia bacterium]